MIGRFVGDYKWLCNFYPCEITIPSFFIRPEITITCGSTEHYYQAQKAPNTLAYRRIMTANSPGISKCIGRVVDIPASFDWDNNKFDVMRVALRAKFSIPELRDKLLATGDEELVEGNYHNDKIWGVCLKTNVGENWLGKLLMELRAKIRSEMQVSYA